MFEIESGRPRLDEAVEIAVAGFVQKHSAELRKDVDKHLTKGQIVYRIKDLEVTAGFALFNKWEDVLYLSGIILVPSVQGRGIAAAVIGRAHAETRTKYLTLRTQSAIMWRAGEKICAEGWTPRPLKRTDLGIETAGNLTAEKLGGTFPISPKCYGGPLYGTKPIYSDSFIQTWWDSICDFECGDAVICAGRLRS
jgi:hypothetical protein